jgi:hypothetical protein
MLLFRPLGQALHGAYLSMRDKRLHRLENLLACRQNLRDADDLPSVAASARAKIADAVAMHLRGESLPTAATSEPQPYSAVRERMLAKLRTMSERMQIHRDRGLDLD